MGRYCPARRLLILVFISGVVVACGGSNAPAVTPTPNAAESLGIEIAQTYGELLLRTRDIVELRPPAPEAKERLRLLGEEFKLQFGSYACLRDTQNGAEQAAIMNAFDANRTGYLPDDMAWFEDAAEDYDTEDPVIRERLEAIETLDDYAFVERHAESHPGEQLVCT